MKTTLLPDDYTVLAPDGSEIRELVQTSRLSMVHCTLKPGAVSKAVAHRTIEEAWHFLSGKGQVWRSLNGRESVVDVSPGVSLTIEPGTRFQFRNAGDEDLCFIIATAPPWPGADEAYPVPDYWETTAPALNDT